LGLLYVLIKLKSINKPYKF